MDSGESVDGSMKRASISSLKAKLSQYLAAVKGGQEIVVTERGRPVARISPVRGEAQEEERLERLVRTGQLRPPRSVRRLELEELDRPSDAAGRSLSALLEERAEGR